jgi:hypothetical protein
MSNPPEFCDEFLEFVGEDTGGDVVCLLYQLK